MRAGFSGGGWGDEYEFPDPSPIDFLDGLLYAKANRRKRNKRKESKQVKSIAGK